jgi:hypothetical protein
MTDAFRKALNDDSDEGTTLALSSLWELSDEECQTLCRQLLDATTVMSTTPRVALRRALECILSADLISNADLLADLCVAGLRYGRESDAHKDATSVVHRIATGAVVRYFDGAHLRAKPHPGDVRLFWDAGATASDVARAGMHLAVSSSLVPQGAAWHEEWFKVTAPTRFQDPTTRGNESRQFAALIARGDDQRRNVAQGLVKDWHGSLSSLDETVTNLIARGF